MLRKNGVKVISATEIISDTAEGVLLESLLEGMAEYYSADLAEKVIRGLTENALKCKYNGGTLPMDRRCNERMEDLEQQKTELSIQIIKEEMTKPIISAEDIEAYFNRLRKLNFKRHDHRRRLIDTFINKIVLWDDGRIYFDCNYKDCSREMTFAELEEAGILGSDISALGAPEKHSTVDPNLSVVFFTFVCYT